MDRAYSMLEVKSFDEDERVIEGIASTPTPDRMNDVVEPMGAKFTLPMPLLWQHSHKQPVGFVEFAKPTPKGIPFKARILKIDEPGVLKDRLDEAWQSVKLKLVKAVSIGFRSIGSPGRMMHAALHLIRLLVVLVRPHIVGQRSWQRVVSDLLQTVSKLRPSQNCKRLLERKHLLHHSAKLDSL